MGMKMKEMSWAGEYVLHESSPVADSIEIGRPPLQVILRLSTTVTLQPVEVEGVGLVGSKTMIMSREQLSD